MDEYGMYQDDEWYDDDPEDYDDWEEYDEYEYDEPEPEPRPLTLLERFGVWFSRTRIGRAWHVLVDRAVDVDDIPF